MKRFISFDVGMLSELTITEIWILDNILFMEKDTGWCFSTKKELASYHKISYSMLHRYLTNLEQNGWIKYNQKRHIKTTKMYHILVSTKVDTFTKVDIKSINKSEDGVSTKVDSSSIKKELKRGISVEELEKYRILWNELAKESDLGTVIKISQTRANKLKSRIEEAKDFKLFFVKALEKIKDSSFLTGANDRGWKVDFDWMIENDTNMIKLIEGKYDDN